jgi:hypothetical protein
MSAIEQTFVAGQLGSTDFRSRLYRARYYELHCS